MKIIAFTCLALTLTASIVRAGIIAGPITNPANGHDYYLLTTGSWYGCEAEAEKLDGHLAVIRNEAEQRWVYSTFGNYGGAQRGLWIGLHRKASGGPFSWVDGTPVDYTDWYSNEPNNSNGKEDCAQMRWDPAAPGTWNDLANESQLNGVVEVVDKSKGLKALHDLVGQWYEEGNIERPCYVAASGDAVFAINDFNHFSGRMIPYKDGTLYVAPWQARGEVIKNRILWSNGTWWSRQSLPQDNSGSMINLEDLKRAAGGQVDWPEPIR